MLSRYWDFLYNCCLKMQRGSLVVQFTRMVKDKEFPLNPDDFQTSSKGQVAGLAAAWG